ncbi:MAG: hypothetical protein ACYDAX_14060, partial [Desulfobacteria bacterium]
MRRSLLIVLVYVGCASAPECKPTATFAEQWPGSRDGFWFTNAVVNGGYHGWSIAPEEYLLETAANAIPLRVRFIPTAPCPGGDQWVDSVSSKSMLRVSGRARLLE